jgi:uncharacterized protein YdaU (DUF1376 family)
MNFFKLYIGDYQRDTAHLSITEHGAFMLMLQHYYATEKPLPTGKALHRMLRAQDKVEREAIDAIVLQFWRETPEGLVNDRGTKEIAKAEHQRTVNREVGLRGGRPKQTEQETESVIRKETESVSEPEPNDNPPQTPDTRHQTNTPKPPAAAPDGFAEFWSRYPRKTAKPRAVKAFRAARLNGHLPEVLADIEARTHGEWSGKQQQFIPHPATYLHDRRWEDASPSAALAERPAWEGAK